MKISQKSELIEAITMQKNLQLKIILRSKLFVFPLLRRIGWVLNRVIDTEIVFTFFRNKFSGLNGRQFAIVASEQPPFVLKKVESLAEDADQTELWDGLEVRLLQLLSPFLNYKMEIKEAEPTTILCVPHIRASLLHFGISTYHTAKYYLNKLFSNHLFQGIKRPQSSIWVW